MRISGIFALGGGYDYGYSGSRKKGHYPYGGYYGYGYRGDYSRYDGPYGTLRYEGERRAILCGSRFL